jgi:hypothetical protein
MPRDLLRDLNLRPPGYEQTVRSLIKLGVADLGAVEDVGQGDELLAAISADPDQHQQAQLVLFQPDVHMVRSDRGALPVFLPVGF